MAAPDHQSSIVSYQALADATGDFAALLGHGGFGTVYLGELNGRAVAVKVLDAARGHVQEFRREVDVLGRPDARQLQYPEWVEITPGHISSLALINISQIKVFTQLRFVRIV